MSHWFFYKRVKESIFTRASHYLFETIVRSPRIIDSHAKVRPVNHTSNKINSQEYNAVNCIPLFFFNVYRDGFNLFFLIMALLQIFPSIRVCKLNSFHGFKYHCQRGNHRLSTFCVHNGLYQAVDQ